MNHRIKAAQEIAKHLKPGDVINTGWKMNWWNAWKVKKWLRYIASWRIQQYQKAYFGDKSISDSTHTRIYLEPVTYEMHPDDIHFEDIFEITTPEPQFVSLYSIALEDIRILRYTKRVLQPDDIHTMFTAAERMLGHSYDELQLVDFLLHQILGYPKDPFTLFDEGPNNKVCSTGVATLFQHLRNTLGQQVVKTVEINGVTHLAEDLSAIIKQNTPRLFDIVHVDFWKYRGVFDNIDQCLDPDAVPGEDRIRTAIERVTPAHFENSDYFQNEFREVARFKNGERYIYPPWDLGPNPEATTATHGTIIVKDEDGDM